MLHSVMEMYTIECAIQSKETNGLYLLRQRAPLQVKVNKITSTKTQLPYEYYSLDYCKPGKIINSAENLGEVLRGDRIENSPYIVCYKSYSLQILMASVFKHCVNVALHGMS